MTTVQALQGAREAISEAGAFGWAGMLAKAISVALMPPSPAGTPSNIAGSPPGQGGMANIYQTMSATFTGAHVNLAKVANSSLPTTWRGAAAENAAQAIRALSAQALTAGIAFHGASGAMTAWASALADAQRLDTRGSDLLQQALAKVNGGSKGLADALSLAYDGCSERLSAAKLVEGAATDAETILNQLAATARSGNIHSPDIDPLTSVVLSYASDSGWTTDPLSTILSPNGSARASQSLDNMSPTDRAAFEKMLADANSAQEAAYLWKALGAGYSLDEVRQFDQVIHPHGNDLRWMSQRLDPQVNDANLTPSVQGQHVLGYAGQTTYYVPVPGKPDLAYPYDFYYQLTNGDVNAGDCVAASTVVARAANDPVFMLGLTTGEGPGAVGGSATPGDASAKAFRLRLEQVNTDNYNLNGAATNSNANHLLSKPIGSTYSSTPLDSVEQRQQALPKIEAAVNAGKPVPLDVHGTKSALLGLITEPADGHQVMILAAKGNELEIYNPWGFTQWVTTQQFENGQLGDLTSNSATGGSHIPDNAELPQ